MRVKSELYKKEQTEIINNIINILELHKKNLNLNNSNNLP